MRAPIGARVSIAAVSAVVLLVQIAATRLLSATIAYHGAFAVLALVMLALAGSASAVFRDRSRTDAGHSNLPAAMRAIWAGPILAATAFGYIVVGAVPWPAGWYEIAHALAAAVGLYASFHACGYVVAWLLSSSSPGDVGRVYFADLTGAALGCLIAVPVLTVATPVQILIACGAVTTVTGLFLGGAQHQLFRRYGWIAVVLGAATVCAWVTPSLVRLRSAKVQDQSAVLFERGNQLARLTVTAEIPGTAQAVRLLERTRSRSDAEAQIREWTAGWAVSDRWRGTVPNLLWLELDTDAVTQILERGGTRPLSELEVLRWDVTAVAYWLLPGRLRRTFVIGGGGGRDFLTALSFGAESVDVVELNPLVVDAVQERFAEFSGRPYTRAGVHYRIGDARSELSRSTTRYDLIQMSMIDTWAASMTGALTLSENALYTREAFQSYLNHLSDDGIFTVSRWYSPDRYAETARILSLMSDAVRRNGQPSPADHVAVIFNQTGVAGVATSMMKRSAFTAAEREALAALSRDAGFGLLWPEVPGVTVHHTMDVAAILGGEHSAIAGGKYDLSPPSDDRPFFFNTSRLFHIVDANGAQIPVIFGLLLGAVLLGSVVLVFDPLRKIEASRPSSDRVSVAGARAEIAYFAAIGASFMGVELGLLQRYIVFLGHPTYALSLVLFSLLVSTGVGSLIAARWPGAARRAFPLLLVGLTFTTLGVPALLQAWHAWPLAGRLAVAAALIVPLGTCMGTAFPSGVRALHADGHERLVPWMWAVNGLAGTAASIAGMLLAMESGYTALLFASTGGYAIAWAASARFGQARARTHSVGTSSRVVIRHDELGGIVDAGKV